MPITFASVDLEYQKHSELKREDVEHLQQWLQKLPHLPPVSDLSLIFFLRSCNYSIEKTKITIDNFYTIRALTPEIFGKRDRACIERMLKNYLTVPIPKLTKEGYQIFLSSLKYCEIDEYSFSDENKLIDIIAKIYFFEKGTCSGLVIVFDTAALTVAHVAKMNFSSMKKFLVYLQEALPMQLKQIHFINASSALEKVLKIVRPFINKQLYDSMHVHSENASLFQYIPQECIPKDYGGSCKSTTELRDEVSEMVLQNLDFIEEDDEKIADESKRIEKSTTIESLFGMDGCFKQLDID